MSSYTAGTMGARGTSFLRVATWTLAIALGLAKEAAALSSEQFQVYAPSHLAAFTMDEDNDL
eukprot:6655894-Pyramimonas_sp.AAC.1